jgi:anti-anti-sigma regulatory factor
MGLLLTSHRRGRCLVVNVCGNVGAGTEGLLHTRLRDALESDLLLIAVNLAEAVLADAYALDVLTSIHRRAAAASKVFLVVAPDPQAHETIRVTGLDQSLLVFPTVADFHAWNGDPGTQPPRDPGTQPAGGASLHPDKPRKGQLSLRTWLGFLSARRPWPGFQPQMMTAWCRTFLTFIQSRRCPGW